MRSSTATFSLAVVFAAGGCTTANPLYVPDSAAVDGHPIDSTGDDQRPPLRDGAWVDVPPADGPASDGVLVDGTSADYVAADSGPLCPSPKPGPSCEPGQRRWCSSLADGRWRIISCQADGSWPMKLINGKEHLDCSGPATGHVPATKCGCYHPYFNADCCECPGCLLPAGTNGQQCPPGSGELCAYCDPAAPNCLPGAYCLINQHGEAFCGQLCSNNDPCPTSYDCLKIPNHPDRQCVPDDLSCFN